MSRRARFGWWVVAVLGALAAPVWLIFGGGEKAWLMAATAQSLVSLTGMVWLLRSTPGDAVRLPIEVSVLVIGAGYVWCLLASGGSLWTVVIGALVGFLVVAWAAHGRRDRVWACVLVLWHPVMFAGVRRIDGVRDALLIAATACAVTTAYQMARRRDRAWHVWVWLIGGVMMMGWSATV